MNILEYVALLFAVTTAFAYANHYLLGLPRNSGLLVIALVASVILRVIERVFPATGLGSALAHGLAGLDFSSLLLNGFLGPLLFAGALHVDLESLLSRKWTILALATVGVVLSALGVAAAMYGAFRLVGIEMPAGYCLVFGALISPTDPVTVLNVLRRLGVPQRLQAIIGGESLFNDGFGIVLYTIFLDVALAHGPSPTVGSVLLELLREAGGGALLGLATGGLAMLAMRGIDEYSIEIMISLVLVAGTYGMAQTIHVSGPVAVVAAGLLMGSLGVRYAVSGTTRDYMSKFWALIEQLLNALLFLLIGLEFAAIDLKWSYIAAAGLAVVLSLAVRGLSITLASLPLNLHAPNKLRAIGLLTWSGLRGGVSVALALSLPQSPHRAALITACYGVVIFTMIAQGLTLQPIGARLYPADEGAKPAPRDAGPPET